MLFPKSGLKNFRCSNAIYQGAESETLHVYFSLFGIAP